MKTSIAKLLAALAIVASIAACASTGGPELHSNDLVYDGPFQIG